MRWDKLFDDLEGQLEQELSAEELDLRAEEERLRLGRLTIRDRLAAMTHAEPRSSVRLYLADGSALAVRPVTIGRDWLSGEILDGAARTAQCVIPIFAVASLAIARDHLAASLATEPADSAKTTLPARLSLAFVLRDLCRRRAQVEVRTTAGSLHGTIDRVGRDHLDLAMHAVGEPRRDASVSQCRLVPFTQIVLVRV